MENEKEDWQTLCELVANESDPQRLQNYLDQLIRALDARKQMLDTGAQVNAAPHSTESGK